MRLWFMTHILGDFNRYSHLWDPIQPLDAQGSELREWTWDLSLYVLSDGSPSRTSCITGNDSSPDLSIRGRIWSTKTSWKTAEPISSSDHLPIQIDIHHSIRYQLVLPFKSKWRRNGVDRENFSKIVNEQMRNFSVESNLSKHLARFTNMLNSVAHI